MEREEIGARSWNDYMHAHIKGYYLIALTIILETQVSHNETYKRNYYNNVIFCELNLNG